MRGLVTLVLVAVLATACAGEPGVQVQAPADSPGTVGETETVVGEAAPGSLAWEHLARVDDHLPDRAAAAVVQDADALAETWAAHDFAGDPPEVDFQDHVVLFLGQADDACPDELIGLEVAESRLAVGWLRPPGPCNVPLIFRLHAVRVHRAVLGEGFTYGLEDPFDDDLVEVTVELPPYEGEAPPAPVPPRGMTAEELDAVFADHPVARCGPEHQVVDFSPGNGTTDARPVVTIEEANAVLTDAGFDADREVVPFVEWSTGARLSYTVAADDEATIRDLFADAFGDEAPDLRVTRWAPAEVNDAMVALQPLLGAHMGERGRIVTASGAPGPVELGMIDPTREALDEIAALVDASLVCVRPELSGVLPGDG